MEQEVLEIVETEVKTSREYPMVALRGLVVFPQMNLNFDVNRKISIQAVEEAMNGEQLLFLANASAIERAIELLPVPGGPTRQIIGLLPC